jgi:hypothetical protein
MRNRLLRCALALLGLTAICHPSTAQVVAARWQFADTNGNAITGTPTFQASQTITWRVYLADQGGPTAPFLNKTTTGVNGTIPGISGFGVSVSSSSAPTVSVVSIPAPPGANNSTSPNITGTPWAPLGASASNSGSTANNISLVSFLFLPSTTFTVQADATGRIFMGTYQFVTGATPGTATLTAATRNGFTTYSGDNSFLDPSLGSGTQALTVTAIPEPGSMLLCGLGAVGLAAYRRRSRQVTTTEEAAQ